MAETIRAIFKDGKFEPLGDVAFLEGEEVTLSVSKNMHDEDKGDFYEAAGAWKDLVDCDRLILDIYTSRLVDTREEPKL